MLVMTDGERGPGSAHGSASVLLAYLERPKTRSDVRKWLRRLRVPRHMRDDVAQDVLLEAVKSVETYDRTRSRPERWLNRVAVNVAANFRIAAAVRSRVVPLDVDDATLDPLSALEAKQAVLRLRSTVAALQDELGEVLRAYDLQGVSMRVYAQRKRVSVHVLYKRRAAALAAMAKRFSRT